LINFRVEKFRIAMYTLSIELNGVRDAQCMGFVDILSMRARYQAASVAFSELSESLDISNEITYGQLDARARAVAVSLLKRVDRGARCLVLYPPGIEAVTAFFGCLYAGILPVPVLPFTSARHVARIARVVDDSGALIGLSTSQIARTLEDNFEKHQTSRPQWLQLESLIDEGLPEEWSAPQYRPGQPRDLAFLQYTSGSTGTPRGVCVTHANLIQNANAIESAMAPGEDAALLSWLPVHHDMGLIGCMLQPIYTGVQLYQMSPLHFARQPLDWLRAISRYRATFSGASDFAYRMCIAAAEDGVPGDLDLSCWRTAFSGAEVIRTTTLDRFAQIFSATGFSASSFMSGYGMAEATLWITGMKNCLSRVLSVSRDALENGEVKVADPGEDAMSFVGCGNVAAGGDLRIVNPQTGKECRAGQVGEVWYAGGNVTAGYWQNLDATRSQYQATLPSSPVRNYLRTGDLGFVQEGSLFISGRLKDLVIINGKNYFPDDLEHMVQASHLLLKDTVCAAFSVDGEQGERLVVVAEPRGRRFTVSESADIEKALRSTLSRDAGVVVDDVMLVCFGQVPRTSSGKLQRRECRQRYVSGQLKRVLVAENARGEEVAGRTPAAPTDDVEAFVRHAVESSLRLASGSLEASAPLVTHGLDSLCAMRISGLVENRFKVTPPLDFLFDGATLETLRAWIGANRGAAQASGPIDVQTLQDRPDSGNDAFALRPIQRAYVVGRDSGAAWGGVSTYIYVEFDGRWQPAQLEHAWNEMILRHDALRTVVTSDGRQSVLECVPRYPIPLEDLSTFDAGRREQELTTRRERLSRQVLPLDTWPLFDLRISRLAGDRCRLHFGLDMLIADLASIFSLLAELNRRLGGRPQKPLPNIRYRDCVLREQAMQLSPAREIARRYWLERIDNLPPPPPLPIVAPQIGRPQFVRRKYRLAAHRWNEFSVRAAGFGLTRAAALCVAYAEVLTRWSGSAHFHLCLTMNDRLSSEPEIERVIGDFTCIEVLEIDNRGQSAFVERAARHQRRLRADLAHRLMDGVDVLQHMARQSADMAERGRVVFTSGLGLAGQDEFNRDAWLLGDEAYGISQTPQVVLDHQVLEMNGELVLHWDAVEDAFPMGFLDDMFAAYVAFLNRLATNDDVWRSSFPLPLPEAQRISREAVNATARPLPDGRLDDGFWLQAEQHPEAPALLGADGAVMSYGELGARANAIAAVIRNVAPDARLVAVSMPKNFAQIAAVIGTLRHGAGYVPIDPQLPLLRREQILARAEIDWLLVAEGSDPDSLWPSTLGKIVLTEAGDVLRVDMPTAGCKEPRPQIGTDLAYVIFTSGSTGIPKGVALDHRGPLNTIVDLCERLGLSARDRVFGISSLSFDLSVFDIFGPLSLGGALVLPLPSTTPDPAAWVELMRSTGVTVWNSVPALMETVVDYLERQPVSKRDLPVGVLMLSGDWIPPALPGRISALWPDAVVLSLGGATEASIWSISHRVAQSEPGWSSVPYGKPLGNQTFAVLDERLDDCPDWVTGELYIGGEGLAQGYIGDPLATASHFVKDRHSGARLYRTGDMGRYRPKGDIEFLGRRDTQTKVNGYRIELGDIEAALLKDPRVARAVVQRSGDRYSGRLVAWVVAQEGTSLLATELRQALRVQLPAYMVPEVMTILAELPLTANGKVDRAKLDEMERVRWSAAGSEIDHGGRVSEQICRIVAGILGIGKIAADVNVFDMGATSMHLIRIRGQLEAEFGCALGLAELFRYPTAQRLAEYLEGHVLMETSTESGSNQPVGKETARA
jgi:amino acid adenylation domain-containing protein